MIRWISSYSEVKGNEHADELAKEAALGRASRCTDLPSVLQRTPRCKCISHQARTPPGTQEAVAELMAGLPKEAKV